MTAITKDNLDEVQMHMLHQRFHRLTRLRIVAMPLGVVFLLLTLVGDHSIWRWIIVGVFVFFILLRFSMERHRPHEEWQPRNNPRFSGLALLPMGLLFLATGGIDSPLLPMGLIATFFVGTMASPRVLWGSILALSVLIVVLGVVAGFGLIPNLMPAIYGGGSHLPQPTALLVAKICVYVWVLTWAGFSTSAARDISRQIVNEALDARDEVLRGNQAHAQELTVLSGELAHELKNPLANIKGLAVLVSRDTQGKGSERLQVMQHEILRMEEILQEFLTFSRPLSPLSQERVDLQELCKSVVLLHEGIAYARNVTVSVNASRPILVTCDSRKVKQILINLLQNALEAAPAQSDIGIDLHPSKDGGVRIEMRDQGPGLSDEVRAHLFQAGTTSKERGTGLGLALARGLARQHGGDLLLDNQPEGGCVATLLLPAQPRAQEAA